MKEWEKSKGNALLEPSIRKKKAQRLRIRSRAVGTVYTVPVDSFEAIARWKNPKGRLSSGEYFYRCVVGRVTPTGRGNIEEKNLTACVFFSFGFVLNTPNWMWAKRSSQQYLWSGKIEVCGYQWKLCAGHVVFWGLLLRFWDRLTRKELARQLCFLLLYFDRNSILIGMYTKFATADQQHR